MPLQGKKDRFQLHFGSLKEVIACNNPVRLVVAIDGTKVRASNSKKNNFNPKKIVRHLTYV